MARLDLVEGQVAQLGKDVPLHPGLVVGDRAYRLLNRVADVGDANEFRVKKPRETFPSPGRIGPRSLASYSSMDLRIAAHVVLVSTIAACTGSGAAPIVDAGTSDARENDGSDQFAGIDRPATQDASCVSPPTDRIPVGGTCSATVTVCGAPLDECLGSSLRAALEPTLVACGISCGELEVGFSAGCATSVIVRFGPNDGQVKCLKDALFAARFDCVPADGWQRLYVGSCTLP